MEPKPIMTIGPEMRACTGQAGDGIYRNSGSGFAEERRCRSAIGAFSSEVGIGSRKENALK